jgi:hypothetical protein
LYSIRSADNDRYHIVICIRQYHPPAEINQSAL